MQFKRIYIKDFQSIEEIELHLFENKFHHIMGLNNIGKSSIIKAITSLVNNVSSRVVPFYIRDGAESFIIESEDFDGNWVKLSRGKEDYYEWLIGGEKGFLPGTAGRVPTEVSDYFNFYIDDEKTKEIINIRPPRSKLLFVDTTFGENYYLLQKALKIEEFLAAIRLGDKRKREIAKHVRQLNERLEEEKELLQGIKDYGVEISDLEVYEVSIERYGDKVLEIEDVLSSHRLVKELSGNDTYDIDYDSDYVRDLVEKVQLINSYLSQHEKVVSIEDGIYLKEQATDGLGGFKDRLGYLQELVNDLVMLEEVDILESKVNRRNSRLDERQSLLVDWQDFDISSRVIDLGVCEQAVGEGKSLREKISKIKDKETELATGEVKKKEFMLSNGFCPTVMSMPDKRCPFNNKTIEELLQHA